MGLSVWHVVVVLVVVLILFGAGKLPQVMGDVAKGIKNFKAGLSDDDKQPAATPQDSTVQAPSGITHQASTAAPRPADSAASSGKS
jgi:sec-independent protein translocase protein TatA